MSKTAFRVIAAVLCALAAPSGAFGWGATGHRMIGELAIEALPEELPAFSRTSEAATEIGELAREADRSRGAGAMHDTARDPGHGVDVDDSGRVAGGPLLYALPVTREDYESALRAAGTDSAQAGYLPYTIIDGWQQVAKDFALWRADVAGERLAKTDNERVWFVADRARRERLIIDNIGIWAHYVGDGSQPLHVTIHYDGWGMGPNPNGFTTEKIHAPLEGAFVRNNLRKDLVRAAMLPFRDCVCDIEARMTQYLRATAREVVPLYTLEKQGGFKPRDRRGIAFMTARVAAGATELRDMIILAWRASDQLTVGYPPATIGDVEAGKADVYGILYGLD